MPIEFGIDFAPNWAGTPPGMSPEDLTIWKRWHPLRWRMYDKFNFNVHLITPTPILPNMEPEFVKMWEMINAHRIDVLGWRAETVDIIEIRSGAELSVIGQLMGYRSMAIDEHAWSKPLRMILVTDSIKDNVRKVVSAAGVIIEVT